VLIDTHCHIDRFSDPAAIAARCERERLITVAVTNLPSHYSQGVHHVKALQYVKLALGFHPLVVGQYHRELDAFLEMLPKVEFVGEIGLDFSNEGLSTKAQQLAAFRTIAKRLAETHKFVTLHSRGAADTVLAVLEEFSVTNAVFHWYTGPLGVLDRAIDRGFYFSVNPSMIHSNKGRGIITRIPRNRVLTESDGPYAKIQNRPTQPSDVSVVIEFLAKHWGIGTQDTINQVFETYSQLIPPQKTAAVNQRT
jgi:TatD DNase family protein